MEINIQKTPMSIDDLPNDIDFVCVDKQTEISNQITQNEEKTNGQQKNNLLNSIQTIHNEIFELTKTNIEVISLITIDGDVIVYQNGITTLCGSYGSHKTRLVETIIIGALQPDGEFNLANIGVSEPLQILLIDTEQDKREFAVKIKRLLNKIPSNQLDNFYFASLLPIPRNKRTSALKQLIEFRLKENSKPLLCCLDVTTDMLMNFNNLDLTFELIDYLLNLKNDYNVSFLCVIHLNPSQAGTPTKARGHLGTELTNKSIIECTISVDKNECIKLKTNKIRHSIKWEKQFEYDNGLLKVLSNKDYLAREEVKIKEQRIQLLNFLADSIKQEKVIIDFLVNDLEMSRNSAKNFLKSLIDKELSEGKFLRLDKQGKGNANHYRIENDNE